MAVLKNTFRRAKMSTYGLSTKQIADVLERDERTILEWQKALGQKCESFHLALCTLIGLTLMSIVIWMKSGPTCRNRSVNYGCSSPRSAQTKFWVNFELGSRTSHTAHRLLRNLVALMPRGFEHFLLVTTDKLAAYEKAAREAARRRRGWADLFEIANCFQNVRYAYLQIVKQRRKRRLLTVKQRIVQGKETDFRKKSQNTSYIERLNLTLRQKVSYLQRKTLGYCKNQKNFNSNVAINIWPQPWRWVSLQLSWNGKICSLPRSRSACFADQEVPASGWSLKMLMNSLPPLICRDYPRTGLATPLFCRF